MESNQVGSISTIRKERDCGCGSDVGTSRLSSEPTVLSWCIVEVTSDATLAPSLSKIFASPDTPDRTGIRIPAGLVVAGAIDSSSGTIRFLTPELGLGVMIRLAFPDDTAGTRFQEAGGKAAGACVLGEGAGAELLEAGAGLC
mmetsp:Transcript_64290/g.127037  ORF Transcript_64290/g.127037 Transcript_64290/m.127037 type:complete len:143 (-) Transcript_64290:319-747(-)